MLSEELACPTARATAEILPEGGSCSELTIGQRCHPRCDKLAELNFVVERWHASGRVTLRFDGDGMAGVLLEIDAAAVEAKL